MHGLKCAKSDCHLGRHFDQVCFKRDVTLDDFNGKNELLCQPCEKVAKLATYLHIDMADSYSEWCVRIAETARARSQFSNEISGRPSDNEEHMNRQSIIRCSRQPLYVLDYFLEPQGVLSVYADEQKGYNMAKDDCLKQMLPLLRKEVESSLPPSIPTALLNLMVSFMMLEPVPRDTSMHNREQSEYLPLFPVMSDTPGNPMSDDDDLQSEEDT